MNTYKISKYGWSAEIVPELGAKIIKLIENGKDVIVPDNRIIPETTSGISIMFPAEITKTDKPLLSKAKTREKGIEYCLPVNDEKSNAYVNGELYKSRFDVIYYDEQKIELFFENHGEVYPFDFKLNVRYEMLEDGIKLQCIFKNYSEFDMPILLGINTCFMKPDMFSIPIKEKQTICNDGIPDGTYQKLSVDELKMVSGISPDKYNGRGFYSSDGDTAVIGKYNYMISENFNHWAICANDGSLRVEPISGAVNGLNFENSHETLWRHWGEIFTAFIRAID